MESGAFAAPIMCSFQLWEPCDEPGAEVEQTGPFHALPPPITTEREPVEGEETLLHPK